MIDERDFKEWLEHPVTKEVRKMLAAKRADLRNEWEMSEPASFADQGFVLGNAANIGYCRGLAFAESLDFEDYTTELENEERIRAEALGSSGADRAVRTGAEGGEDRGA